MPETRVANITSVQYTEQASDESTPVSGARRQYAKADGFYDIDDGGTIKQFRTGTVAIAEGGTGQTTQQAAIDALTDVAAATNEHVLTKDTGTGNAIWKAGGGGGGSEFADDVFRITGSADATKKTAFEVDGLTTATTRTLTVQDVNGTVALVDAGTQETRYVSTSGGDAMAPKLTITDSATFAPLSLPTRSSAVVAFSEDDLYVSDGTETLSGLPSFRLRRTSDWIDLGYTTDAPITVENTSGGTVVANDVGYIDDSGEYKETTTANADLAWCVVIIGGANNTDIKVARVGKQTVVLNANCSIGDYLVTSTTAGQGGVSTVMRPEIFGVFLTANVAGAGGTADVLLLTNTVFKPVTSDNEILLVANHSGTTFSALINGAPGATTVVYDTITGNENSIVPSSSSELGKLVLHNTTRGDSALIQSVNVGTNTITVDSVPGAWANNDAIQVNSLTNTTSLLSVHYFDVEMSSSLIPTLSRALHVYGSGRDSGAAGIQTIMHPFEADATGKRIQIFTPAATIPSSIGINISLIDNKMCLLGNASGAATKQFDKMHILGAYVAVP
jgi:hypothetical protein